MWEFCDLPGNCLFLGKTPLHGVSKRQFSYNLSTSLADSGIVRAGKEIGANDYSSEILLITASVTYVSHIYIHLSVPTL
jgi:hypothetical protein